MNVAHFRSSLVQRDKGRPVELFLPDNRQLLVPRDERERGDGTYAYGLVDRTPGRMETAVLSTGAVPYQHLLEMAQRNAEEPELRPPPITFERWNEAWGEYVRAKNDRAVGRKRFYQTGKRYE